ncbi:MAG: hypothetical protein HY231_03035 [Acidobacteria bacterium]|nr:hypothetical protein [Acidobacteriota bacterium]
MNRITGKTRLVIFYFCLIGAVVSLVVVTGLLDYIPRLRASAISPNGDLTVMVFQKRLSPRPFFPRMGAIAKIYDRNGKLLYAKTIFYDSDFDDTLGDAFNTITFEKKEIHISPGFYDSDQPCVIQTPP